MRHKNLLEYKFVEFIPENKDIQDGYVYISLEYATIVHKCCCGCKKEVVTPLSPSDWKLIFDGESISLYPSIGNWNFKCRSHYLIRNNRVIWLPSQPKLEKNSVMQENRKYFIKPSVWKKIKKWWK